MIDAVLSYHTNPYACGVAKFNQRLARELGVPFDKMGDWRGWVHPLLSYKIGELPAAAGFMPQYIPDGASFDLFLHDWRPCGPHRFYLERAERVYAANAEIARAMRAFRPGVIEAWCPSTIEIPPPRADLTVLTFGMAHKQAAVLAHYQKLKALLDAYGEPYTILVSTGVHEGSPWDEALEQSAAAMRGIFGAERVEVLGFLSDAALHREILNATACAAFYDPALRANNTTAWAVLERGRPLLTNVDADSPRYVGILKIDQMTYWPVCHAVYLAQLRGWSDLLSVLKVEQPCVS